MFRMGSAPGPVPAAFDVGTAIDVYRAAVAPHQKEKGWDNRRRGATRESGNHSSFGSRN